MQLFRSPNRSTDVGHPLSFLKLNLRQPTEINRSTSSLGTK